MRRVSIKRCDMPAGCAFSDARDKFYYWDSFLAPLKHPEQTMTELYLAIFAHPPRYFARLLTLRGKIVRLFGLRGHKASQFKHIEIKDDYRIGEKIALFTLYAQSDREIVSGGDDKHLDFRVSVLKVNGSQGSRITVTTVVTTHNLFGRIYLFLILPMHRFGVRTLLSNAVAAGRL